MKYLSYGLVIVFALGAVALAYLDGYEKREACGQKGGVLLAGGGYAAPDVCLIGVEKAQ